MKLHQLILNGFITVLIIPVILLGYANSPPNGRTGAPGEGNCAGCHSSFGLNSGNGTVSVLNVPMDYVPGEVYTLMVTVSDPGLTRWGFELAVKDADNDQAGIISVTEPSLTTTGSSGGITYLKQRAAGTFNGQADSASWEFEWTAPDIGTGPVTFYLGFNETYGSWKII